MTADHSQFESLQKTFTDVEAIQRECVACHNLAEAQLHQTIHWQWRFSATEETSNESLLLGKLFVLNGYHPNVASNANGCGSCHIGFGLSSKTIDDIPESSVDCLICHDTSGEYAYNKFHQDGAECTLCHDDGGQANKKRVKAEGARFQLPLTVIAQSVGATSVQSCGSCHFYDGGADGAKHGDLDSALIQASFDMDVHMSSEGAGLTCSDCHQSDGHQLSGSRYQALSPSDDSLVDALEGPRATCQSCHGLRPMKDKKLNDHTDVVACQTCHIPTYARNGIATKLTWDWSTAGKLDRKQRPFAKYNQEGRVAYASGKGDMTYGENLVPTYQWYNGRLVYKSVGTEVDPSGKTSLNESILEREEQSKIFPFHVFESHLPYDTQTNSLLPINLLGRSRNAFWNSYDWEKALKQGARTGRIDFSGSYDFTSTTTIRALNHTVAPKEEALECVDCHSQKGLMSEIPNVYVPGASSYLWLDRLGALALIATLVGVSLHGIARWIFSRRRRSHEA